MATHQTGLRELSLFAGSGGGILAGHLLGWRTVCAVERDAYAASVLARRQSEGFLHPFPIWDSIETFDPEPWSSPGVVDVISGGFPCTDISSAGSGAGIEGKDSGLWKHMARAISSVQPQWVFIENSPMLAMGRGLGTCLCDLSEMGYDARWCVLGAHHFAGIHKRDRIWILGNSHRKGKSVEPVDDEASRMQAMENSKCSGLQGRIRSREEKGNREASGIERSGEEVADSDLTGLEGHTRHELRESESRRDEKGQDRFAAAEDIFRAGGQRWWEHEPIMGDESHLGGMDHAMALGLDIHGAASAGDVGRVAQNIPNRTARLKCIGNGQVPLVAAAAFHILQSQFSQPSPKKEL